MKQINIVNTINEAKNLVAKQLIYDNAQKKIIWTIQPNQGENFSLYEDNDDNIGPDIFVVSITYHNIDSSKEYQIYSDFRSMKVVKIVYNDREIERYVYVDETNYYDILYRFKFDNDGDNTVHFYFSKDFTNEEYILLDSGTIKSSLSITVYLNKYISNIPTLGLVDKIICDAPVIKINKSKFFNPYKLESFEYSGVIEYITDNAFDCSPGGESVKFKYMSLNFKEGLTYIGNNAFQYALIVGNLNIPSTCKYVGNNAFDSCKNITSVTINDGVEYIGQHAFYNCTGLIELTLPNSLTSIEEWTFYNCTGLTELTLGNSLTSIGDSAFFNCMGLTEIILPNSIKSIGNSAFVYCTDATIYVPETIETINSGAFGGVKKVVLKNYTRFSNWESWGAREIVEE